MARPGPPKKNDSGAPPVPFKKLYTFATNTELFMVVLSCLAAVVGGTVLVCSRNILLIHLSISNKNKHNISAADGNRSLS
jgi:hypothetical protein